MSLKKNNDLFWRNHYENWKTSREKQKDYCFIKGISYNIFRARITKIRKEAKPAKKSRKFLPVPAEKLLSINQSNSYKEQTALLKLNFKEKFTIEIPANFSQKTLFQVIEVLETT